MIKQILVLALIGLNLGFRLFYVNHFNFAFTIDQARDMLEIRKIAIAHHPVMIGPTTSINGVYLGPFWYYFNLPAFILGRGDPTALVYWGVIFYHLSVFLFWTRYRKTKPYFGAIGTLFFLISPRLLEAISYSFNANAAPTIALLTLLLLEIVLSSKKPITAMFLGLMVGLSIQVEAAFCILFLPLVLFWLIRDKVRLIVIFLVGFTLTLIPQIAFEVKHKFLMTKIIIAEFAGSGDILGDKLSMSQKLADRYFRFLGDLGSTLPISQHIVWISLLCLVLVVLSRKTQKLTILGISLIIFSIPFYLLYPHIIKPWYTISLAVPFILIFAGGLSRLCENPKLALKVLAASLLLLISFEAYQQYSRQLEYKLTTRSADRASLLNQIEAVDLVYQEAAGSGFKVYDYTPSVYDFNYQYLFWWYGSKTYGYQPISITYQDNVPVYIETLPKYQSNIRQNDRPVTFLIKEGRPGFEVEEVTWRHQFDGLCKMGETELTGNIVVEKLTACHEKK